MYQTRSKTAADKQISSRRNSKWNASEISQLHHEYVIAKLSLKEIAKIHKRSESAIINKISKERLYIPYDDELPIRSVVVAKKKEPKHVTIYMFQYLSNLVIDYFFQSYYSYKYEMY